MTDFVHVISANFRFCILQEFFVHFLLHVNFFLCAIFSFYVLLHIFCGMCIPNFVHVHVFICVLICTFTGRWLFR